MKILLRDFNKNVGRENIFKLTIGNEGLHQDSNDNDVRKIKISTPKNLVFKYMMFPHRSFHKYTSTSPVGKTQKQIDHIWKDRRWHLSILDVRSFRGTDCDTDQYLAVEKLVKYSQ
jgi:hypothetical protein